MVQMIDDRAYLRPLWRLIAPLGVVVAALPLLAAGAPVPAKSAPTAPPAAPSAAFGEEVSVGWVTVPVVVRNGAGYVKNLDKEDFRLLVDGRRVEVESFERRSDAPASVVFLQDLSGSMEGAKLDLSREVVRYFLDQSHPGDEFAIATFASGTTQVEVPFTADVSALREEVDTWQAYGTTSLHDAVSRMPAISNQGHNPKRFAIVISDGVDNASRITPAAARA